MGQNFKYTNQDTILLMTSNYSWLALLLIVALQNKNMLAVKLTQ
jgi:hypothetical protein